MVEVMKKYLKLFFVMLKIGLFTFGGGYAMIALLENEFVSKLKWINEEEFTDMVAISESTPGPIAINSATYIGYKIGSILGSFICTVAICIPSFVIIYIISLFFNAFMEIQWIAAAFKGIQVCVVYLILSAGIRMLIKMKKTAFNIIIIAVTSVCMILFSIFAVDFSSVLYILISGIIGLLFYTIKRMQDKKRKEKDNDIS